MFVGFNGAKRANFSDWSSGTYPMEAIQKSVVSSSEDE